MGVGGWGGAVRQALFSEKARQSNVGVAAVLQRILETQKGT